MIKNCKFTYKCPQKWESLESTKDSTLKFCENCKSPVYLCSSESEIRIMSMSGECIAVNQVEIEPPGNRISAEEFYQTLDEYSDYYNTDIVLHAFKQAINKENAKLLVRAIYTSNNEPLLKSFIRWFESCPDNDDKWEGLIYIVAGVFTEEFDPDEYSRNCRERDKYAVSILRESDFHTRNWLLSLFK
jgi:hypothetical protein